MAGRPVGTGSIIARGFTNRCPNCGSRTMFPGILHWYGMHERCSVCGFKFEKEPGFFLGAIVINYGIAGIPMFVVLMMLAVEAISVPLGVAIIVAWVVIVPILTFRLAKSLWLTLYYVFLPNELPANAAARGDDWTANA